MSKDFLEKIIRAHKRSYQRALEVAVRTGTALVFEENGKIVKEKPAYRYELVPIKSSNRKSKSR